MILKYKCDIEYPCSSHATKYSAYSVLKRTQKIVILESL